MWSKNEWYSLTVLDCFAIAFTRHGSTYEPKVSYVRPLGSTLGLYYGKVA